MLLLNILKSLKCVSNVSIKIHAAAAAAAAKSFQSCPTLCNPMDGSPPGIFIPGILQARTGVGCHCLLQCMKVKGESEVAQLCPTLSGLMDCSLPGSSIHRIFQVRVLEWGAIGCHLLLFQDLKICEVTKPFYASICRHMYKIIIVYEKSIFAIFELNFKSRHLGGKFVIIKSILRLYYSPFSYKTLNTASSINLFCIGCLEAVCGYIMICQLYRVIS